MERAGTWRPFAAPRESTDLGGIIVRRCAASDAEAMDEAIRSSVDHLRPWMAWIAHEPCPVSARRTLIDEWDRGWRDRTDFTMGIFDGASFVGGTGLHLRGAVGTPEIGYWVRADRTGEGIATRVVGALVEAAFALEDVVALEIHHDIANVASGRVAEKSGFVRDRDYDRPGEAPGDSGRARAWVRRREPE